MTDDSTDFADYAGHHQFPRSTNDLLDTTRCPACFSPLATAVCRVCDLDLNHPSAGELAVVSSRIAGLVEERTNLIGRIRFQTDELLAKRAAPVAASLRPVAPPFATAPLPPHVGTPAPSRSIPASVSPAGAAPASAAPFGAAPGGAAPGGAAPFPPEPEKPRRSSIQITLLVVGVALLSIFAIFAVVFAVIFFNVIGLLGQSLIVAAMTATAFFVASRLKRKGLESTAEGIACLAVVLTYLDAFAVRSNNILGLGSSNPAAFWGAVLVASSLAFLAWHRLSGLRSASIVAWATFAPGVGLLVAGLANTLNDTLAGFLGLAAVAAASLTHRFVPPARAIERMLVLASGAVALIFAAPVAFTVETNSVVAIGLCLGLLAVIAGVHVLVASTAPDHTSGATRALRLSIAVSAAVYGAVLAAGLGGALATRVSEWSFTVFWPLAIAAAVALMLEAVWRRLSTEPLTVAATAVRSGVIAAACVAVAAAALPVTVALGNLLPPTMAGLLGLVTVEPGSSPAALTGFTDFVPAASAIVALGIVTVVVAVVWAVLGVLSSRLPGLVWAAVGVAVLAVSLLDSSWALVAVWWTLAAALLVALLPRVVFGAAPASLRRPLFAGALAATALSFIASWSNSATWLWGSLATLVLLALLRPVAGPAAERLRAAALGTATGIALLTAGASGFALARDAGLSASVGAVESLDWLRAAGILATVGVAIAAVPLGRTVSALDRRTVFWIVTPVALITALAPHFFLGSRIGAVPEVLPEPLTSFLVGIALLAGLLLWVGRVASENFRWEKVAATIAVTSIVYWVISSFALLIGLPRFVETVAPGTAAVIVAAAALVRLTRGTTTVPRWCTDVGIVIIAVPSLLVTVGSGNQYAWLMLLLAAITTALLAVSADGVFASGSPRKHLGWAALALAAAGLWVRLWDTNVVAVEPYVLPVAGAVLAVALLMWRSETRRQAAASVVAPAVALAGLLVAILPIAVDGATGPVLRPLIVAGFSAVLLLAGTASRSRPGLRIYQDVAAGAGAVGVLVTALARAAQLTVQSPGPAPWVLDAWVGAAFLLLMVAAFRLAGQPNSSPAHSRNVAAQGVGVAALLSVLALEVVNFSATGIGAIRVLAVVLLFCAVHVVAQLTNRSPLTSVVGWTALGSASIAAVSAIAMDAVDPWEIVTLPIAAALACGGVAYMQREETARSWPQLGPAILVLLVPSLLATAVDRPMWRLVALGVVAVALIVVGATRKLQAPLVLGSVVALVHGLATFSDEVRAAYEAVHWSLWLGFGGILLIVLAARYEQRVQNFKTVILKISSLR